MMSMSQAQDKFALYLQRRKTLRTRVSAEEWHRRVELAACYRLMSHFRMTDWIYNHISARVPGSEEHYLINPFGLMYDEVTASSLIKVDVAGKLVEDDVELDVNPAAFIIHGAVHRARPDVVCVIHTHTTAGIAVAAQEHGLLPISQHASKFHGRIAYHDFEGLVLRPAEQERLVANLADKPALILKNHGLLALGFSVPDAFKTIYFLERACQIQIAALAGGSRLVDIAADVAAATGDILAHDHDYLAGRDWQALIRMLNRSSPDYQE